MKHSCKPLLVAIAAAIGGSFVYAQGVAEIAFDSNPDLLRFPDNIHMGEAAGVATNSRGQFNIVHGIAIDAQGNVFVGDEGNKRVQVFDSDGTFTREITGIGSPTALCITPGPRQVLYVAHTGDPDGMEDAAIYKVELDGTIVGKFGKAGKEVKQFGLVNSIDCRNENELLVGELSNWRVQKLTLRTK